MSENSNVPKNDPSDVIDWWTHDRVLKELPMPIRKKLTMDEVYGDNTKPNVDVLKSAFIHEALLEVEVINRILKEANRLFKKQENMVKIESPVTICGDVHGQFYDLLRLFEIGGDPKTTKYLFLGDYVDRGCFSCECVLLLWAYKLNYPNNFTLIRGNHECRHLTDYFTFKTECLTKYNLKVYNKFCNSFNTLPLAALVNKQFLCLHGGLSPEITKLEDINKIERFREPPSFGAYCDILWSDPIGCFGNEKTDELYTHNSVRGCSYYFTHKACCEFLKANDLLPLVRAHEAQDTGYRMYKKNSSTGFPALITIFSAPNYLDMYNNGGAVLKYDHNILNIRQFKHSPHPYWLPNFIHVFTWAVPFVIEKVAEILNAVIKVCSEDDDNDDDQDTSILGASISDDAKKEALRNKIRAVGRMSRMFGVLREENETIVMLKGISPNGCLPTGFLSAGRAALIQAKQMIESGEDSGKVFETIKQIDLVNEKIPPLKDFPEENTSSDVEI